MTVDEAIRQTLDEWHKEPFQWAGMDCDGSVALYVQKRGYSDPMAKWRGAYTNEEEARAFIDEVGGNLNLITEGLASVGIEPQEGQPKRGDVVVAEVSGREICGICLGLKSAFKREGRGAFMTSRLPILRAFPC